MIKPSTEYKNTDGFALLIQGPPMTGKTNLAMMFEDPLFITLDHKLSNATRRFPGKRFWFDDTADIDDTTQKPLPEEKRWEKLVTISKQACLHEESKTLVVDNLSIASDYLTSYLVAQPSSSKRKDGEDAGLVVGGQKVMSERLWGPFKTLMQNYVSLLRMSRKLVICICHEGQITNDDGTVILGYRPLVPGALKNLLGSFFTDVWRTEVRTTLVGTKAVEEYIVRCCPTPLMPLGNSLGLPREWVFNWNEFQQRLQK